MPTFVDPKARVEVDLGDGSKVWVRARMDFRTTAAVERDLLQLRISSEAVEGGDVAVHIGQKAQKLALLKHNVTRWAGPLFEDEEGKPVPCKPEMFERLDPNEAMWWVDLVVAEINKLNLRRVEALVAEDGPLPN